MTSASQRTDDRFRLARLARGLSQGALADRAGVTRQSISGIESGKIVPRFDTLLDLVRVLDYDLLMVPRSLVPALQALIRDHQNPNQHRDEEERSLYAAEDDETKGQARDEF